jgi:hypothetical protein
MAEHQQAGEEMKPGRKPSGRIATTVRFEPEKLDEMDEIAGNLGRAEFIREAVDLLLAASKVLKRYRQTQE